MIMIRSDEIRTALDIGCGEGRKANHLCEQGVEVTAIDIEPQTTLDPRVHFIQTKFEDYEPGMVFDLVHAHNAVPLFEDKIRQISRMLSMGRFVFFTFLGPEDPWVALGRTISKEEVMETLRDTEIIYYSEQKYENSTFLGKTKKWHKYSVLVRTRNI